MKRIFAIFLLIFVLTLTSCGEIGGHDEGEHEYKYYGEYAQTIVDVCDENEELIEALDGCKRTLLTDNSWLVEYENSKYIRLKANLYEEELQIQEETVTSQSGLTTMTNRGIYYFKVEPIKWRIIDEDEESYTLLCEYILDHSAFNSTNLDNIFSTSSLFEYLNGDFKSTAFKTDADKLIGDIEILCINQMSIFTSKACRAAISTDYARANGLSCSLSRSSYGYSNFWVSKGESEILDNKTNYYVDYLGAFSSSLVKDVNFSNMGIRPVIKISK